MMGVRFSGELAYEVHAPNASLDAACLALRKAGVEHGLQLFGARAAGAMRMEKGFLHWKADLITEFDPFETGLNRFVKLEKGDFIGREALLKRQAEGARKKLVTLQIGASHAPAHGGASLMQDGRYDHLRRRGQRVGMNLAYAFAGPGLAYMGSPGQLGLCGDLVAATAIARSPCDPGFERFWG